jgi:hypothetical protein
MRVCVLLVSCLLVPLVPVAAACDRNCDSDDDCAAGLACRVAGNAECASTCVVRPLRGEQCSASSDDVSSCEAFVVTCDDGLVCASATSVGTCAPTEGRVLNETCNLDDQCEASLVCAVRAEGDSGECAPATGRGTDVPCNDDAQCASGSCSDAGACT